VARGIHDVTVNVPGEGNRRVTIIYPMPGSTPTPNGETPTTNGTMTPGIKPVILVGHGAIGNGSYSANGEGIGFAGSSYVYRSMTDIGYVIIAPHFGTVTSDVAGGVAVAQFFLDYAFDTWAQGSNLDEDAIGYSGTSQGGMLGYAMLNTGATNEPRFKAYYLRATSRTGSTGGSLDDGPALVHAHGSADNTSGVTFTQGQAAYASANQPKAFIPLPGIAHDLAVTGPYFDNISNPNASGLGGFFGYFLKGEADGLDRLEAAVIAVTNPNTASIAEDWGDLEEPPVTGQTAGHFGTHLIQQMGDGAQESHSPSEANNMWNTLRQQIINGLNTGAFVAMGPRMGWDCVETGRVKVSSVASGTVLNVSADHPAIASGTTLRFATFATVQTPITVTTSAAAAANSPTITVNSTTGITANMRAGVYDPLVLNTAYNDVTSLGYKFNPRFMNGKYTPLNLITDGSPVHFVTGGSITPITNFQNGGTYHEPYNSAGTPNPIVLLAITQFYEYIFNWADTKTAGTIPIIMAGTLPGMDYAELWFGGNGQGGDYLTALHGQSETTNANRMVTANNTLMDMLVAKSADRYPIGFGISGLGNLFTTIAPGIATHAVTFGEYNNKVFLNANGWHFGSGSQPDGEWGSTQETTFDNNVWPKHFQRGVQDIGSPNMSRSAADWTTMFTTHCINLPTRGACWAEIYAYQVRTGSAGGGAIITGGWNDDVAAYNSMINNAIAFNALFVEEERTVTLPLHSMAVTPTAPNITSNLISTPLFSMPVNMFALSVSRSATMPLLSRPVTPIAPVIAENKAVTIPLYEMPVTPVAPLFNSTLVEPPLFNMAVQPIEPTVTQNVTMPLHSQAVTPTAPVVASGKLVLTPLFSMAVRMIEPLPQFRVGVTTPLFSMATTPIAPVVTHRVAIPLFSLATTPIAPSSVQMSATMPLLDMSTRPIEPSLFQASVSLPDVQPPVYSMATTPIAPTFIPGVPNIIRKEARYLPTISKQARYLGPGPRRTKKARYLPIIRKRGRYLED
jgi:hypothetical protein